MCFLLDHCQNTIEAQFFFSSNFRIGTEHLISFGRYVFTDIFWFSKIFGTFKLFVCFQHKSHSTMPDTFRDSAKHSRVLLYMHRFQIVSLVNSWVARLLCLPPMFRFVRLGVQRENHCDCASSSHG